MKNVSAEAILLVLQRLNEQGPNSELSRMLHHHPQRALELFLSAQQELNERNGAIRETKIEPPKVFF